MVTTMVKSLRLIRLIRILKIYKYIVASPDKEADTGKKKKKKKSEKKEGEDEPKEETIFQKETDPTKLGKAMLDTLTRWTISGILLMLMILPMLSRIQTDFSGIYALRRTFRFGHSSCEDTASYFCSKKQWISEDGWYSVLRGMARASEDET